jgi:ParB-like chromosome segregation protein Spo0J
MPWPQYEQMSRAEDERAAELYELGFSQPEVAGALGRSRKAVRQALKRMGVPIRTSQQGQREWIDRQRVKDNRKRPVNSVWQLGA